MMWTNGKLFETRCCQLTRTDARKNCWGQQCGCILSLWSLGLSWQSPGSSLPVCGRWQSLESSEQLEVKVTESCQMFGLRRMAHCGRFLQRQPLRKTIRQGQCKDRWFDKQKKINGACSKGFVWGTWQEVGGGRSWERRRYAGGWDYKGKLPGSMADCLSRAERRSRVSTRLTT